MSERELRLDGLRGVATILVVVSHFLGEVPSRIPGLSWGFFAVCMFFVLSGFLIGRLILERSSANNFYKVFYARRFLRTLPSYVVVVSVVMIVTAFSTWEWVPGLGNIPALSYATFTQNLFFSSEMEIGSEWLAPTWTLAVEEQFYLVAPLAIIWTPSRFLLPVLSTVIATSIAYRFYIALQGQPDITYLPSLLGNADALAFGIVAAVLQRNLQSSPFLDRTLEVTPLVCVCLILVVGAVIPADLPLVLFMRPLLALASAAFILRIVMNTEASEWLRAPFLCRVGHNSYSIYLVHMPVAGITHGLITGLHPDIGSPLQIFATALSFLATSFVAVALTKLVEDPATNLGRRLRWGDAAPAPEQQSHNVAPRPQQQGDSRASVITEN